MDKNPKGSVETFCKYVLARTEKAGREKSSVRPPDLDGHFMKVIMRFSQAYNLYARIALKNTGIPLHENFTVLAVSRALGESRKSDVINFAMIDLSTGSDILNRLVKEGYLKERTDPDDKRSKLIAITSSGEKALHECFKKTLIARKILLKGLGDEDKKLCIQILEPHENRHSVISVESKNRSIEDIARDN